MTFKHLIDISIALHAFSKCNCVQCANEVGGSESPEFFGIGHLCRRLVFLRQLRPDGLPVVGAKFDAGNLATCGAFNGHTERHGHWSALIHPLIYKAGRGSDSPSKRNLRVLVGVVF